MVNTLHAYRTWQARNGKRRTVWFVTSTATRMPIARSLVGKNPHIWPNPAIDEIADRADALIETAPADEREELIDAFTWGLAEDAP